MIAESELRFRRNLDVAQDSGQTALLRLRVAHVILEQQELQISQEVLRIPSFRDLVEMCANYDHG